MTSLSPIDTITIFQRQPEPKSLRSGQVIFQEGQPADYMYGVLSGAVEIAVQGQVIETLEPGAVFGIGALIRETPRRYTAIAKTDCQLVYLDEQRFLFVVQETPLFAIQVLQTYSDRLMQLAENFQL